jgi:chromosome segregation ATPase
MADKDLGESLENMEEGIENLKNKEFRILGIKVTFMSVTALVTVIGTVVGSLYGGFLMYQKIEEAIAFVDQQQEYQELMAGYDERMGIIEIKLEEAVDYTRDIKDGLRADILKTEAAVDRMEDKVDESEARVKAAQASIEATLEGIRNEMNQVEKDVAQSIREVESLNRETEKDVRDTMRATEGRIDEDMRTLDSDIRELLQEALDNPLNDMK